MFPVQNEPRWPRSHRLHLAPGSESGRIAALTEEPNVISIVPALMLKLSFAPTATLDCEVRPTEAVAFPSNNELSSHRVGVRCGQNPHGDHLPSDLSLIPPEPADQPVDATSVETVPIRLPSTGVSGCPIVKVTTEMVRLVLTAFRPQCSAPRRRFGSGRMPGGRRGRRARQTRSTRNVEWYSWVNLTGFESPDPGAWMFET